MEPLAAESFIKDSYSSKIAQSVEVLGIMKKHCDSEEFIAIQENISTNLSDKIPHCCVKLPCSATARLRSFSLHCEISSRNLYAAIFLDCYNNLISFYFASGDTGRKTLAMWRELIL